MGKLGLGVLLLMGLALVPAGCSSDSGISDKAPIVRVRLLASQDQVTVAASAAPIVKSSNENQWRKLDFPGGAAVPVTLSPAGWRIGNATFASGELVVRPERAGSVTVNGSAYRGLYRFVPVAADRFDVVNDVDIDSYLMGVISSELLQDWNIEAYRAQAIVARTYALYEVRAASAARPFDLYDDDRSQVYGGISAETAKSRQCVIDTSGVVVAYGAPGQERIFKAYFSSCCGGVGQSASDAFGEPDFPPLADKNVGSMCNASPRFNWGPIVLRKEEVTRRIRSWGVKRNRPEKDIAMVARIDIAAVNRFQRPVRFYLTDVRGLQYSLSGEEIRTAVNSDAGGGPTLYSSFFRPINDRESISFAEGHGWGHGAGMCQWCTEVRAERGVRHEDIVRLSYPGAVLVRAY